MAQLNQAGFSRDTYPNLYKNPQFGTEYKAVQKAYVPPVRDLYPARDSRYPAYAGPMQDARLVTDYRPQCSKNIRAGIQFNTKSWLVNHAEDVIDESRKRQIEWTGASLAMANTVPPPADIVHSNPFYSEVNATNLNNGIGIERANAAAPMLFGTFSYEPTMAEIRNNRKNISLTVHYEGGRNSPRGTF
jgi:hypothetical protein